MAKTDVCDITDLSLIICHKMPTIAPAIKKKKKTAS
jgi:hypothetical protein